MVTKNCRRFSSVPRGGAFKLQKQEGNFLLLQHVYYIGQQQLNTYKLHKIPESYQITSSH